MSDDHLTPELVAKLTRWLTNLFDDDPRPAAMFNDMARGHGIGLVDLDRQRALIDERVYEGALYRGRHWRQLAEAREPVPMILYCPRCGTRHIDLPDPLNGWTNPPHRSHLCADCGFIWRPADIATVGVAEIATRGRIDGEILPARAGQESTDQEGR